MAPLVLLAALGARALSSLAAVHVALRGRPRLSRLATAGAAAAVGGHPATLFVVNRTATHDRAIGAGEAMRFCGFHLDCHVSATVMGVERAPQLGVAPYTGTAEGEFHVVTVRVANDARRGTLQVGAPVAWVEDATGRRHDPSSLAHFLKHGPRDARRCGSTPRSRPERHSARREWLALP